MGPKRSKIKPLGGMSCAAWRIIRRPEYRDDFDAIEAWIAQDNARAAVAMWLVDG
jgi:toxin ParE1/3/4